MPFTNHAALPSTPPTLERRRPQCVPGEVASLSGRLIAAQEGERSRIARELHDDIGQRLALLALELHELTWQAPERAATLAARAQAKVQTLSADIHRIACGLHPLRLEMMGFPAAVRLFCQELEMRYPVQVVPRLPDGPKDIPRDLALVLYRVAQEALQNAVKHSGASRVEVELIVYEGRGVLTVRDEGRGFDVDSPEHARGLGLPGMAERLRLVGGSLDVQSSPGHGTLVLATVPLERERQDAVIHTAQAAMNPVRPNIVPVDY